MNIPSPLLSYWSMKAPFCAEIWVAVSEAGLFMVGLDEKERSFLERCRACHPASLRPSRSLTAGALSQLKGYFNGRRKNLDIPLDRMGMSSLHWKIMDEVSRIPYGTTASYGEIARKIRIPRCARAVGQALSRNRTPIAVPCHRVVSARGLGGFGPGLTLKERLLRHEGWNPS